MSRSLTFLLTILVGIMVVSHLTSWYWMIEVREEFGNYRKLEESNKKNLEQRLTAIQKKVFRIEEKLKISAKPAPAAVSEAPAAPEVPVVLEGNPS